MLSGFHVVPERNWQTDRWTDRRTNKFAISISRVSMLMRDKKTSEWCSEVTEGHHSSELWQSDTQHGRVTDRLLSYNITQVEPLKTLTRQMGWGTRPAPARGARSDSHARDAHTAATKTHYTNCGISTQFQEWNSRIFPNNVGTYSPTTTHFK